MAGITQASDWTALYELDELNQEREKGLLYGFEEAMPQFPPTYKYKIVEGTGNLSRAVTSNLTVGNAREYDDRKQAAADVRRSGIRTPAWTDRVLFKALPETVIKMIRCDLGCELTRGGGGLVL